MRESPPRGGELITGEGWAYNSDLFADLTDMSYYVLEIACFCAAARVRKASAAGQLGDFHLHAQIDVGQHLIESRITGIGAEIGCRSLQAVKGRLV
jgi:hypothetical protein